MDRSLPIALVGAGRLARLGWLPAFRRAGRAHLAGIVDVRIDRARALAGQLPYGDSLTALAGRTRLGGVVVATPPASHLACASEAAALGLACLVEKPPTGSLADARALAEIEPPPWIGFNRRFEPAWIALVEAAAAGRDLRLEAEFAYAAADWGVSDDAALLDAGSHLVDAALRALGTVRAARLSAGRGEHRLELSQARGHARLTVRSRAAYVEGATLLDGAGRTLARVRLDGPVASVRTRLRSRGAHPLAGLLAAEIDDFAHGGAALADARDGLAVMEVLGAAGALEL